MTPELTKPQVAQEQLDDLNRTLEKEKVELTPEVEEYTRSHVRAVQNKLQAGQDVYESDLAFIPKVKIWVRMPKELREKYRSVDEMIKSKEVIDAQFEANKRHISLQQWYVLLEIAICGSKERKWIDERFTFPGAGKIISHGDLNLAYSEDLTEIPVGLEVGGGLYLQGCTALTKLPEELSVAFNLELNDCTSLTEVPEGLSVGLNLDLRGCNKLTRLPKTLLIGGHLYLSESANKQIEKDADKLKKEGKIIGGIVHS